MSSRKLLLGWGETDITPANAKVELSGQYYQRLAQGIHSRLKAVALALDNGQEQAVLVALDVVGFDEELQLAVRKMVSTAIPDIRPESIFLNAIHTHNAPYTRPTGLFRDWLPLDPEALPPAAYVEFLKTQILAAVRQAWSERAPGGIAPAFGRAAIGHCRRAVYSGSSAEMYGDTTRSDFTGMEAGVDSGVEMLFTFSEKARPTGMIVNLACPSQVMEATYLISSDFMGAARENLQREFGSQFHTLCQVSAAGCQSPRDLVRNYRTEPDFWHADGVGVHAGRLSRAVLEAYSQTAGKIEYQPVFRHTCRRLQLPLRRVSYQQYSQAVTDLQGLLQRLPEREAFEDFCRQTHANEAIPGRPGPYDSKLHHFVLIQNARAVVKRYQSQDDKPYFDYDLQALRLGDCAMVNCPFELYLCFGQIIKARSPARQTFVVQLSGGSGGYLPSPEAERLGGYGGLIINGKVGADGGYLLADAAGDRIRELWQ